MPFKGPIRRECIKHPEAFYLEGGMSENQADLVADHVKSRETEIKFDISREEAEKILSHPLWRQSYPPETRLLNSVYFDTSDRLLLQAGYSLRIRDEDGKRIQTIKTLGSSGHSLTDRGEWSCSVRGRKPNIRARAASVIRPALVAMKDGDALEAIFSIAVKRRLFRLEFNGAEIEVAVDHGELLCGDRQQFHELELELISGDTAALFALAFHLFRFVPLQLHMLSKAERGFAAIGDGLQPARAARLDLDPRLTPVEAFQNIARSCLRHLLANTSALRDNPTPDAIHQARVAIRRLRAAMGLFRDIVDDSARGPINAELRWIARELGVARALDVYLSDVLQPAVVVYGAEPDFVMLLDEYNVCRERAYQGAVDLLHSARFGFAVLSVIRWIECGQWLIGNDTETNEAASPARLSMREYASWQLTRRWKKVRVEAKRRRDHTDEQRHRWRIDVKKLRYACEFFSSLYGEEIEDDNAQDVRRKAARRLSSLQDNLGELNDIAEALSKNPLSETALKLNSARAEKRISLLQSVDHDVRVLKKILPFWKHQNAKTEEAT